MVAIILFVTELLWVDVVALLVMISLVLLGPVTPVEALAGLSNPAVVTVGDVLVLSAGLARTGIAKRIGHQVMRVAGKEEIRLVPVIMLTAAAMSAFMNDIGVAALLLPVIVGIASRTGLAPSKLLIPLASLSTQVVPNTAVAVLLAPIAVNTADDLGMSPQAHMLTVALAASAAFLSPVGHPLNVLVTGPRGYRFADYLKVGIPLSLVVLVVLMLVLPIFGHLLPRGITNGERWR